MVPHHEFIARERIQGILQLPACVTARSPAFNIRGYWRCSSPCPLALVRKVKDWVRTKGNGADSSA